jgi:hypothetical protein
MSDDLLAKSYEQLESMERTLQRAQMLQSQGRETLQGLSTNEEAMTLETSNRDSTTPLGIIRASISEYERTQELFAKISTQPGVTEEDKSHAEAQAARAKSDFEEARRTYNEVYMTYYQSNLEGLSQQEHTDEASTRRPHEDVSQIRMNAFVVS